MNDKDDESELAYAGMETTALTDHSKSEDPLGSILVHPEETLTAQGRDQLDPFLVTFDRAGDIDPRKWSKWYLIYIHIAATLLAYYSIFCSTIPTAFAPQIAAELKLNSWMVTLALSHYEICFCVASPLWGWLSDQHGRKRVLLICLNGIALFHMGCALSQSAAVITFCRLMVGLFASGIFPITTAIVADNCDLRISEEGMGGFTLQLIIAPSGAGMGRFMVTSKLGWRGIIWVFAIVAGVLAALIALTFPETHRPTILANHARHLRKQMHDDRYHAASKRSRENGPSLLTLSICEPVLILSGLYIASIIASLNIYYEAAAIASGTYHPIGILILAGMITVTFQVIGSNLHEKLFLPRFFRPKVLQRYSPESIPPEARLVFAAGFTPLLAIAFLWFGWSASPNVSPGAPISAGAVIGLSSVSLSIVTIVYIIDVYERATATALGWTFALSNVFLAVFPIFSEGMFRVLGVHWAATLSACVTIAALPIPILLMRYGRAMRERSRYARQLQ